MLSLREQISRDPFRISPRRENNCFGRPCRKIDGAIAADQLLAYKHDGFWRSMDTLKDRQVLEEMFEQGRIPWLPGGGNEGAKTLSIASP